MLGEFGAQHPVVVHDPYPDDWDQLHLVASVPQPGPGSLPPIASGQTVVRAMRAHAAATEEYAANLERFLDAGWTLSLHLGRSFVELAVDTLDDARQLPDSCGLFRSGQPIELWVADGSEAILGGGLLVDAPPHPDLYPPRTFPALVLVGRNGAQLLVEDMAELRNVITKEVMALAGWLDDQQELVRDLGADVPLLLHAIARDIASGGEVPRLVNVALGPITLTGPQATVEVCPVTAAVWSGIVAKAGVDSYVALTMPYNQDRTGIALGFIQRGEAIASHSDV
jgi:hypothetical protein